MLIVVCGLPGSGKSYFASHLAKELNAVHLKSDAVRKDLQMMGNYDETIKNQVYEEMIKRAWYQVQNNETVILDATFNQAETREMVKAQAQALHEPLYFIYLKADDAIIYERVSKERPDSEADFRVYQKLKAERDPFEEDHLELDSGRDTVNNMIAKTKTFLGLN